jgi:hypothetical protein
VSRPPVPLNRGGTATVTAAGTARVQLGPDTGPPQWLVTGMVVKTSRPGTPPIPQCSVYLDTEDQHGLQDVTYDGSFDSSDGLSITVPRGSHLIAVWSGAQAGDVATLSVTGLQVTP